MILTGSLLDWGQERLWLNFCSLKNLLSICLHSSYLSMTNVRRGSTVGYFEARPCQEYNLLCLQPRPPERIERAKTERFLRPESWY